MNDSAPGWRSTCRPQSRLRASARLLTALFEKYHQRKKPNQAEVTGRQASTAGTKGPDADLYVGSQTQNKTHLGVKTVQDSPPE